MLSKHTHTQNTHTNPHVSTLYICGDTFYCFVPLCRTLFAGWMGSLMLNWLGWESMFYTTGFLSGLWALFVWQCFLKGSVNTLISHASLNYKVTLDCHFMWTPGSASAKGDPNKILLMLLLEYGEDLAAFLSPAPVFSHTSIIAL